MTDLHPYRAEPDAEFADRLERALLRQLGLLASLPPADTARVIQLPLFGDDDVADIDVEVDEGVEGGRRDRTRLHLVAAGLVVAGLAAVLVLVGTNSREYQPAAPVAANGLIAFVGKADDTSMSDIFVVAPDGTGLRRLTATLELVEYAPAWSPDGSRLAFVRTNMFSLRPPPCATVCQLVVVDPATGVETFAADIPQPDGPVDGTWVPRSLAWSPDGRAIVIPSMSCGAGGCGGMNSVIADLETGAFTTFTAAYQAVWSPDGEWISLVGPSRLLVPAGLIEGRGAVDVTELPGVRPMPEGSGDVGPVTIEWMPDGSAMLVADPAGIDVVTIADGEHRTLIEYGFDPVVSPDSTQIAYVRSEARSGLKDIWVAAADGSDPRRVTASLTAPAWSPDGSLLLLSDAAGSFTMRPDGTDRTALGIRDRTPRFPLPGVIVSGVDWQRAVGQ